MGLAGFSKGAGALLSLLLTSSAFASSLFPSYTLDSATVLPKGVRSLRLGGFSTEISNEYGDGGGMEVLGADFNKSISVGELIQATPAGASRGIFKGGLEASGVSMTDKAGDAAGWIDSRVTTTIPTLAYGVSERWTVAMAVPIMYSNMHPSTGWNVSPEFQQQLNALGKNGYYNPTKRYQQDLQNVIQTELRNYGYDPLVDQSQTGLGDMIIGAKYQAYKQDRLAIALSPRISLPTGRAADVNRVVDIAPGDGHADLSLAAIADYRVRTRLTWNNSVSYMLQMPTVLAHRIPLTEDNWISPDVDKSAHQKLGDIMGVSTGLRYEILPAVMLGGQYAFQYKAPDFYSGNHFNPERYHYLSYESEQVMNSFQIGVSYSTVPLVRAKRFEVPLDLGVNYATVLAGRNVKKVDLVALELASYF